MKLSVAAIASFYGKKIIARSWGERDFLKEVSFVVDFPLSRWVSSHIVCA